MLIVRCLVLLLALGLSSAMFVTRAAEVTLTAVADTSLWQRQTNHNLGGTPFLPAGNVGSDGNFRRTHMLLKFSLEGAIPDGAPGEQEGAGAWADRL